jgi:anti-sigma regulatory factor (Ser/Thr protein kinase)
MTKNTIYVPDTLRGPPDTVESFLSLIAGTQSRRRVVLNFSAVTWIYPYGAAILLEACRYLAKLSGHLVRIASLRSGVHAYLRRIDFFERLEGIAYTKDPFDDVDEWSRNPASPNVLELVSLGEHTDVYEVGRRARKILQYWLGSDSQDIDWIVSLLAEACSNVVDHSNDAGAVTVQKYEHQRYVDVELAISDMGIGICKSLANVHGEVADTVSGYIEQALNGLSARKGRGGQGLGAIQRITTKSDGSLYIRSETGSVLARSAGIIKKDELAFLPGTQIAIKFRSQP